MSDKCKKCGGADFTAGGKCRACQKKSNQAHRAKHAGSAAKTKKTKAPKVKAEGTAPASLVIDACFGLEALVNGDGYLEVQQRNNEGEVSDTLVMTRLEFKALVEKFSGWAAA